MIGRPFRELEIQDRSTRVGINQIPTLLLQDIGTLLLQGIGTLRLLGKDTLHLQGKDTSSRIVKGTLTLDHLDPKH